MLFRKSDINPVYGSPESGSLFDVLVTRTGGKYRMDFSWRDKKSLAVSFSDDGINWSEPQITLANDESTGWEDNINRHCIIYDKGKYLMWYTGQARGHSYIGYAESTDGIHFERKCSEPVIISEFPFEGESCMNPCVLAENGIYRMWYSAGETCEPNVICYAESTDGINWKKSRINPILVNGKEIYEQNRIGGCQVIKTDDLGYVMMYIGYENISLACICACRSENGITNWKRCELNPIIYPSEGEWDADACYKPSFLWNEDEKKWMLWYNGRKGNVEYIGMAEFGKRNFFEK